MDEVIVDGVRFRGDVVPVCGAKLLVIQGGCCILGCGYLSVATADKLNHALAIVTGVSCYEDMLAAEVKEVSAAARQMGATPGMSGAEALLKMHKSSL